MKNLKNQLDDLLYFTEPEIPDNHFDSIAEELLTSWRLVVGEHYYYLSDIEFYLNDTDDKGFNYDPFTHKHIEESGILRFHGSGFDISIGKESLGMHGGILIRGIRTEKGEHINGPLLSAQKIFGSIDLIEMAPKKINLEKFTGSGLKIYRSARINLNPFTNNLYQKDKKKVLTYRFKPWRYFTSEQGDKKFLMLLDRDKLNSGTFKMNNLASFGESDHKRYKFGLMGNNPEVAKTNGDYFQLLGYFHSISL